MLIQLVLALGFLFAAVNKAAGFIPACFSVTWLLHTRNTMQRVTAGLQRGWAPALICAFMYLLFTKQHRATILLIAVAWLLHAPSALLMTSCYGLYLLWGVLQIDSRSKALRPFFQFLISLPLLVLLAFMGVRKPDHLGSMVSYEQAQQMPEFSSENGRFKMVPLWPMWTEVREFGFQAFNTSLERASDLAEEWIPSLAIGLVFLIFLAGLRFRRSTFGLESSTFLLAIFFTYEAARLFAFKLFVPQRYIQIPMAIYFVTFVPIALWRLVGMKESHRSLAGSVQGSFALVVLAAVIVWGSGNGLVGDANFNKPRFDRGELWHWVGENLPQNALIAGQPAHIDGAQLFGRHRAFVTNETAHPFYDTYYTEMKRRLIISLKAHYSRDPKEFVDLLAGEGVTHFIFKRKAFYPEALASATYFSPLDTVVKELTSYPADEYLYKKFPPELDKSKFPFLLYRDDQSLVVDVDSMKTFLDNGGKLSNASKKAQLSRKKVK